MIQILFVVQTGLLSPVVVLSLGFSVLFIAFSVFKRTLRFAFSTTMVSARLSKRQREYEKNQLELEDIPRDEDVAELDGITDDLPEPPDALLDTNNAAFEVKGSLANV